jgi:colanic acid/amylovoran biosynthesis glycosyltransferase
MKKTLAIFSPNQNAYSETFIQAHKNLPFNIRFYYGDFLPSTLEFYPDLFQFTLLQRVKKKLNKKLNLKEHALLNSLKRERVDFVLAEYGPTACATLNVVKFLKLPLVVHFHGFDASNTDILKVHAQGYKRVFKYARVVIVVSNTMQESLVELGCPPQKLILTTYGPDEQFLEVKPTFSQNQFVAVGRFVEKKAPQLTISAFKKVTDKYPDAKLVIAGTGELLSTCKNLVSELNLDSNVEFKGVQTPQEIQNLFKNSLAFVQHSVVASNGDSEGTPLAVLEAQAAGLPVISTRHAGIPDVVIHEETGLLVGEFDIDSMATNMLRMISDKELAKKMGEAGRDRIISHFSKEKNLTIIKNLIETGKP